VHHREFSVRPAFWDDLVEASEWYDDEEPGLGKSLEREALATVHKVMQTPLAYRVVRGSIRRAMLNRFPYALIYEITDEYVFIIGLVHGKRNFDRWLWRRIQDA
jgi:plasmid stabilization system protein ParE